MDNEFQQYTKEMFKRRRAGARVMSFNEWKDTMVERMELIAFIESEIKRVRTVDMMAANE